MAHKKTELRERPLVEGARNWLWNIAAEAAMDWWKGRDLDSWQKGMYLCQRDPTAIRGSILIAGQALYSAIHLAPLVELYQKVPYVGKLSHRILDELAEGVEQMPDSVFTYANKQRLPEGFTPEGLDPKEIFGKLAEGIKSAPADVAKRIETLVSDRLPQVSGIFSAIAEKFGGQEKGAGLQHLSALSDRNRELLSKWLEFVAKLPADAEDDLRRIDSALCEPGVIESILDLPEQSDRVAVIRRLAKDTFGETVGGFVEGFSEAVDPILKDSKNLRERLDRKRAERRAARRSATT
ncbi:MAG: hypothetical protein HY420_00050 [Candidatus Kerfeldbacteria bacterium]|nr:hypothetical protein [Candidatus Kerfeldbacteria bacterium]